MELSRKLIIAYCPFDTEDRQFNFGSSVVIKVDEEYKYYDIKDLIRGVMACRMHGVIDFITILPYGNGLLPLFDFTFWHHGVKYLGVTCFANEGDPLSLLAYGGEFMRNYLRVRPLCREAELIKGDWRVLGCDAKIKVMRGVRFVIEGEWQLKRDNDVARIHAKQINWHRVLSYTARELYVGGQSIIEGFRLVP